MNPGYEPDPGAPLAHRPPPGTGAYTARVVAAALTAARHAILDTHLETDLSRMHPSAAWAVGRNAALLAVSDILEEHLVNRIRGTG